MSLSIGIPIDELKERLTAKEAAQWKLYRRVFGPFGREREDYNTAMIVCAVRQLTDRLIFYNGGQPGEPDSVEDCLLNFTERKEKTAEDLITEGREQLESLISKFKR